MLAVCKRSQIVIVMVVLGTAGCYLAESARAVGVVDGYARHVKVTGRNHGEIEWYEYKVFLTKNGQDINSNVRAGALQGFPIEGNGHYRFTSVGGGVYSILSTQPRFYGRTKVVPNVAVQNFQTTNVNAYTNGDYFCAFGANSGEWGPSPWDFSNDWYQTFVATGTSIQRISFKLAGAVPQGGGGVRMTVHRDNGGPIDTWPIIGPQRITSGNAQSDNWAAWLSGELPTTPGHTYAVRFTSEYGNFGFSFYRRLDLNDGYAHGQAYKGTTPMNYDLYACVMSDNDGTVIPYTNLSAHAFQAWMWAGVFGQTYRATGTSLAAVSIWGSGGGNSCWNYRVGIRVYQGFGGPQVGPLKICGGAAFEASCTGLAAVSYNPGEVPLTPGQVYYIEFNAFDYDPERGFEAWRHTNDYPLGHAYVSGQPATDIDLAMEIVEYTGAITPAATNTPTNTPVVPTATPTNTATPTTFPDADQDLIADQLEGWPPAAGQTNRYLRDSDGDGLPDGQEDANRNGIRDAGETNARHRDSDGDGTEDGIEVRIVGTDPLVPNPPLDDFDNDALVGFFDYNDHNPDYDGDRYKDGCEAASIGLHAVEQASIKPSLGDVNTDAAVSNVDALITQAIFLGTVAPTTFATSNSDVNRDGFVTNVDALVTQSFFLGLLGLLPF